MKAKITCVYDEGAKPGTSLIGGRGTAFIVDVDGKRVLFDTGLRDRYLTHNLDCLAIDPDSIDIIVISQAPPDNARGLNGLLKVRTKPVVVYAPAGAFNGKPGMFSRSFGLSDEARDMLIMNELSGTSWTEITPRITLTPMFSNSKGYRESFLIVEGEAMAIISGRGVSGPEDILMEVEAHFGKKPRAFIGSIYLEKMKKPVADMYAASFTNHNITDLYLNHCTSREGMTNLRINLGLKGVNDFYVGMSYEV